MLLEVLFVLCLTFLNISSVISVINILSYILSFLGEECINPICDILYDHSYFPSKEYYDPNFLCNSNDSISSYKMLVKFTSQLCNMAFFMMIYLSLIVLTGHNSKILCRCIIISQNVP